MKDLRQAAWLWALSYCLMTIASIVFTIAVAVVFEIPSARELQVSVGASPLYTASLPYHWIIGLAFWVVFARRYLLRYDFVSTQELWGETLKLAAAWTVLSVIADFLVWVVAPTPMQMTVDEMYVRHGLWSALVYVAVFIGTVSSPAFVPRVSAETVPSGEQDRAR